MNRRLGRTCFALLLGAGLIACLAVPASAQSLRIRDLCRIKGQEQNTLHGLGLVVGLQGTGDGDIPSTRALARMMQLMGNPVTVDAQRQPVLKELQNAKNVALVFVTVTVPAGGARSGDLLNLTVNAISAKSLEGGHLMVTELRGPHPDDPTVYGYAQGPLSRDEKGPATAGHVHNGCRLETSVENTFVREGKITLVLDRNHASFQTAYDIEELLNNPSVSGFGLGKSSDPLQPPEPIAKAKDQINIEVHIPEIYEDDPVQFVSIVLDIQIFPPRNDARVVIDKRNGVIVVGDHVLVGRVAVSHKNIAIQTGGAPTDGPLFIVDPNAEQTTTQLKALVDALNALKVSTEDIIEVVEVLDRSGALYGKLIVK